MTLTVQQSTPSSKLFIFAVCLIFRTLNAYLTQTYDNPDEYWQSQEVAHNLVFGYGYMTWEWRERIRSFAHPLVFALLYQLIQWVGLDDTLVLVAAPRYLQAWISATADVATYSLAKKIFSNEIAFPMVKKRTNKDVTIMNLTLISYLLHYALGSIFYWQLVPCPTIWKWH